MRIRRKPWARPELEACPYYIQNPKQQKNRWAEAYSRSQPFHLELGCGKGGFISAIGPAHPEINYLALDIKHEMLGMTRRKAEAAYGERDIPLDNLCLTACNVEQIDEILGPQDRAGRIYINFCNPWPKPKHRKKRLTHSRWLTKYKEFLVPGGELYFKTDDDGLFADTVNHYLPESGFELCLCTWDLYAAPVKGNIPTEHEAMFLQEGKPIKFLIARLPGGEEGGAV